MPPSRSTARREPSDPRRPRSELRHWSTYATVGEWYADYRGYVPIQIAHGLDIAMQRHGLSFPDACRLLLDRHAIIHIDPRDDAEPGP